MKMLRKLLWPFSLLYAQVVWWRNLFYDRGWFASVRPNTPVLCVGNLSVGGSGKTPMVEWILRYYDQRNRRVSVLSRGYGRTSRGLLEVQPNSKISEVGDEPLQIKCKFPKTPVVVDANRIRGIQWLESGSKPELIILDDGFQHRKVSASHNLLLTTWDRLYPLQGYLPSGDLRDHRNQARRADIIIVTKCPANLTSEERNEVMAILDPLPNQRVLFASFRYNHPEDSSGNPISWAEIMKLPLVLVTGVAHPEPLTHYLKEMGVDFVHRSFPDHHNFSKSEIELLRKSGPILTTEKDAVRLKDWISDYMVLGVQHHFEEKDQAVLEAYLDLI